MFFFCCLQLVFVMEFISNLYDSLGDKVYLLKDDWILLQAIVLDKSSIVKINTDMLECEEEISLEWFNETEATEYIAAHPYSSLLPEVTALNEADLARQDAYIYLSPTERKPADALSKTALEAFRFKCREHYIIQVLHTLLALDLSAAQLLLHPKILLVTRKRKLSVWAK